MDDAGSTHVAQPLRLEYMMKRRHILSIAGVLVLLLSIPACASPPRSSDGFVTSLRGKLIFVSDASTGRGWYELDFPTTTAILKERREPESGILSKDGQWRLLFVQEKDTNHDGTIDWRDFSSLYLARANGSEKRQVALPFPVETCAWGTEFMIVACTFSSSDVNPNESKVTGNNSVIYVVDLESGKLLRRLSDPTKTSWSLEWSPDGKMLAFQIGIEDKNGLEPAGIQVVDTRTGEVTYEIAEPSASEPAWSPNGTKLAFVASLEPGEYSGATIQRMYHDVFYIDMGDRVRVVKNVTRTSHFTKIPAALTELGGIWVSDPVWSPDGEAIASVWKQDGDEQIWVTSADGNRWAQLTDKAGSHYSLVEWQP
jgi:Tol biopolymer transport system component